MKEKVVPENLAQSTLASTIKQLFETSWGQARKWIETGKVSVDGKPLLDETSRVQSGAKIQLNMNAPKSSAKSQNTTPESRLPQIKTLTKDQIIHLDTQVIVVNKPPGISTVPFESRGESRGKSRNEPREQGTLQDLVCQYLKQRSIEVVHRIDRETSGLLVFARTREAAKNLANQFRFHTVHRRYFALVHGVPKDQTIQTVFIEDRGDGLRGSVKPGQKVFKEEGQKAITHIRVVRDLGKVSLIECALETGRTHQIRIHLSEIGHPLLGERVYIRDFKDKTIPAPRLMLHAAELGFEHPLTGAPMKWMSELPDDFKEILDRQISRGETSD